MSATIEQARDDLYGVVQTFWDGEVTAPVDILYEDVAGARPVERSSADLVLPYARVSIRHSFGHQSGLSGGGGSRKYTNVGMLIIELWYPQGKGFGEVDLFAQLLIDALRGVSTTNGVWTRNVRMIEIAQSGIWFQTNVLADFEYDQVA
jgi:hypothetical protein